MDHVDVGIGRVISAPPPTTALPMVENPPPAPQAGTGAGAAAPNVLRLLRTGLPKPAEPNNPVDAVDCVATTPTTLCTAARPDANALGPDEKPENGDAAAAGADDIKFAAPGADRLGTAVVGNLLVVPNDFAMFAAIASNSGARCLYFSVAASLFHTSTPYFSQAIFAAAWGSGVFGFGFFV